LSPFPSPRSGSVNPQILNLALPGLCPRSRVPFFTGPQRVLLSMLNRLSPTLQKVFACSPFQSLAMLFPPLSLLSGTPGLVNSKTRCGLLPPLFVPRCPFWPPQRVFSHLVLPHPPPFPLSPVRLRMRNRCGRGMTFPPRGCTSPFPFFFFFQRFFFFGLPFLFFLPAHG